MKSDPTLAGAGQQVTRIQDGTAGEDGKPHALEAYVVAESAASGTLRVLAYDAMNREIGRTQVRIERGADEARYEALPFDAQVAMGAVRKVGFTFRPAP